MNKSIIGISSLWLFFLVLSSYSDSNIGKDVFQVGDMWIYSKTNYESCCNLDGFRRYDRFEGIHTIQVIAKYVQFDSVHYICSFNDSGMTETDTLAINKKDTIKNFAEFKSSFIDTLFASPFDFLSGVPDSKIRLVQYKGDTLLLEGSLDCPSVYRQGAYLQKTGLLKQCREDYTMEWHIISQSRLISYNGIPFDSSKIIILSTVSNLNNIGTLKSIRPAVKIHPDCLLLPDMTLMHSTVVSVYNAVSQQVFSLTGPVSNRIPLKNKLSPGIYFVNINTSDQRFVFRAVLSK